MIAPGLLVMILIFRLFSVLFSLVLLLDLRSLLDSYQELLFVEFRKPFQLLIPEVPGIMPKNTLRVDLWQMMRDIESKREHKFTKQLWLEILWVIH